MTRISSAKKFLMGFVKGVGLSILTLSLSAIVGLSIVYLAKFVNLGVAIALVIIILVGILVGLAEISD